MAGTKKKKVVETKRAFGHQPRPDAGSAASNMLTPSLTLLIKLGSIIVHFDEATSNDGHEFDLHTARQLLVDPEVKEWIAGMNEKAYLPVKRRK